MLLERIEVVGHRRPRRRSAEEGKRAYDIGVDRFLPDDRAARLDVTVQPGREAVGILAGVGADDQVLPVADRAVALASSCVASSIASWRDLHVTRTSQGA